MEWITWRTSSTETSIAFEYLLGFVSFGASTFGRRVNNPGAVQTIDLYRRPVASRIFLPSVRWRSAVLVYPSGRSPESWSFVRAPARTADGHNTVLY
ncbi:hypothetical protein Mapa_003476 [Marchantia paleacea]|nr:hypothetical protein Mapa_003476 [Marchantia paleacea]